MYPFIYLFFILIIRVKTASLPPVYKHGCILLGDQKLYCHGGALRTKLTILEQDTLFDDDEIYNQLIYLDVSKPLNVSFANTQWQTVNPSNVYPFQYEPRADFAIAAMGPDSFIVTGGIGPQLNTTQTTFANLSFTYNSKSNHAEQIGFDVEAPKTFNTFDTPTFGQRGIKVSDTEYAVFGGIPNNNNTVIRHNTTFVDVVSEDVSWDNSTAWTIDLSSGSNMEDDISRRLRGALAVTLDSNVLLFGGYQPQNATYNYNYKDYMMFLTFDTLLTYHPRQQEFEFFELPDQTAFPDTRVLHTVTSIPNVDKMILYGGIKSTKIVQDYCWIYDVYNRTWETAQFTNGEGPGKLYGHQAVMIGDDMLYIIGGINGTGMIQNQVHILNVTSMTWLNGSYTNTYDQMMDSQPLTSDIPKNPLGAGVIAGIVIGCVAGVAILITGVLIIYLQRKKNGQMIPTDFPEGLILNDQNPLSEHTMYDSTKQDDISMKPDETMFSKVKPASDDTIFFNIKPAGDDDHYSSIKPSS